MHIWFKHIKQECIKHAMICFYIIVSTLYTILNLPYAKLHCLLLLAKAMSVLIMLGGGWDSLFHQGPLHRVQDTSGLVPGAKAESGSSCSPSSLTLVSAGSHLELTSYVTWGSFLSLLTDAIPAAPLLPRPCHVNPIQPNSLRKSHLFPSFLVAFLCCWN